jgi:hypothetical protein
MVEQANIEIKRGDTWSKILYFEDNNCVHIDITGWTIYFTAKLDITDSDGDAEIEKTITVFSNPLNGEAELSLSSEDTDLATGNYFYDIQVKTNLDEIYTIVEGVLTITQDITTRND